MNLTYHQSKRVEKVVNDYSRALGFETAKSYINTIVGSALALAEKESIPQKDAFSAVINELRHYYKNNVGSPDSRETANSRDEAIKVFVTLQDRLNAALGKKSRL